jgi:hypothetical protein
MSVDMVHTFSFRLGRTAFGLLLFAHDFAGSQSF